jgi:glycerol kinase
VKVTYGTGSFVLMTLGQEPPPSPVDGILTTVAWRLPRDRASSTTYALEGAVFSSGATIQWLRDGLGIIDDAAAIEPLARATASSEGVVLIPSFTGLGSPWWDGPTGATISGLTKGLGRTHLARAAIEAIAYQTRDVVERMEQGSGYPLRELRADGGAAVMDLLLQLQADQCHVPVRRATTTEATARGAALLAGLAEGFWSLDDIAALGSEAEPFLPMIPSGRADGAHRVWRRELERTRKLS